MNAYKNEAVDIDSTSPRTLVLCFDGTANHFVGQNTNIVRIFELLKKDRHKEQLCYYQAGIGTYFKPGTVNHMLEGAAKLLDFAVAWYLDGHVMDGYEYLMKNYRGGDRICMFGFSRGAYVARALAGLLHKIGLLPKDNVEQVRFAYKLYTRTDSEGLELCKRFKQTFSVEVSIEFLGVFDTVASVGLLKSKNLPFTDANTTIRVFRHALSLDERRTRFLPNLYHPVPGRTNTAPLGRLRASAQQSENALPDTSVIKDEPMQRRRSVTAEVDVGREHVRRPGHKRGSRSETVNPDAAGLALPPRPSPGRAVHSDTSIARVRKEEIAPTVPLDPRRPAWHTDVLEVWFAGCHSDVGGGSVRDGTADSLADISLRWMVREAMTADCGIQWNAEALQRLQIPQEGSLDKSLLEAFDIAAPPQPAGQTPGSSDTGTTGSAGARSLRERELDGAAVTAPIHDELKRKLVWWPLELMPTIVDPIALGLAGKRRSKVILNLGRGRKVPDLKPKFHASVRQRMNDESLHYKPRARWNAGTEQYVD